jgi:hypothetical protein
MSEPLARANKPSCSCRAEAVDRARRRIMVSWFQGGLKSIKRELIVRVSGGFAVCIDHKDHIRWRAARYRRSARNVRSSTNSAGNPDDTGRGLTDEAPRRPITLPRVQFLERPDPDRAREPRRDIEESADPSTETA